MTAVENSFAEHLERCEKELEVGVWSLLSCRTIVQSVLPRQNRRRQNWIRN